MSWILRCKTVVLAFFVLSIAAAVPASADLWITRVTAPSVVQDPMGGFNLSYELAGSKSIATANLSIYVSASRNGSTGKSLLRSDTIVLQGYGSGPFGPSPGPKTYYMHPVNLTASGRAVLQSLADSCQPQPLYLLVYVDASLNDTQVTFGTTKQPDLRFTSGTISPSTIQPGGATALSFELTTRCPASRASRVGIYLTDTAFNPLSYIGAISISAGAGTWTLPPTPISFSPTMPVGDYRILMLADMDNLVAESDENNNGGWFALQVRNALAAAAKIATGKLNAEAALPAEISGEALRLEPKLSEDYVSGFVPGVTQHAAQ
jgi:hypothetical protein